MLEKTLESPLDSKEVNPVNPKGNQPWIFTGRTNAETEAPILWQPDVKSQIVIKDSNAGKDWRWEETGVTEGEMVGWHHQLSGHEFEWTQGSLACCSPWSTGSQTQLSNCTRTTPGVMHKDRFLHLFCLFKCNTVRACLGILIVSREETKPYSSLK